MVAVTSSKSPMFRINHDLVLEPFQSRLNLRRPDIAILESGCIERLLTRPHSFTPRGLPQTATLSYPRKIPSTPSWWAACALAWPCNPFSVVILSGLFGGLMRLLNWYTASLRVRISMPGPWLDLTSMWSDRTLLVKRPALGDLLSSSTPLGHTLNHSSSSVLEVFGQSCCHLFC